MSNNTQTPFVMKTDERLVKLRAELAAIGNARTIRRQAAARLKAAKDALYVLELRAGYERIDPAELKAARAELAAAQADVEASKNLTDPKGEGANVLRELEARLSREEREANIRSFRPVYAAALARLDRALADAAAVAEEVEGLETVAIGMAFAVPSSWAFRLSRGAARGSDYMRWRHEAIEAGWLKG